MLSLTNTYCAGSLQSLATELARSIHHQLVGLNERNICFQGKLTLGRGYVNPRLASSGPSDHAMTHPIDCNNVFRDSKTPQFHGARHSLMQTNWYFLSSWFWYHKPNVPQNDNDGLSLIFYHWEAGLCKIRVAQIQFDSIRTHFVFWEARAIWNLRIGSVFGLVRLGWSQGRKIVLPPTREH